MSPLDHMPPEYRDSDIYLSESAYKRREKIMKIARIILLCSPLLIYLAVALNGLRPVYHDLRGHNIELGSRHGNLVIATERNLRQPDVRMLVNANTGREIPLTRVPWRNYSPVSVVAYNRVFVRNQRNDRLALIDPHTREKIIPFGVYHRTWHSQGDLIEVASDGYWGIVNHQTGEVVVPAGYFNDLTLLFDTTQFIGAARFKPQSPTLYWGIFCLYTQQLVVPMVLYRDNLRYLHGMIVARIGDYWVLICPYTQQELIPYGEFHSVFPINHTFVEVRKRDYGTALMNIATNEIIVPFGMFSSFRRLNDDEVRVWKNNNSGTLNLHTMDVVWR